MSKAATATKTSKSKSKSKSSARRPIPRKAWENIRDNLKIRVVGENPRRKGSELFKLYEQMRKTGTVAKYVEKGFSKRWLPGAVRREYIKLVG
jgi:hypothetical protein